MLTAKEVKSKYDDCYREWENFFKTMRTDYRMTLGDQWSSGDKAILNSQGRPVLSINLLMKPVLTVAGYQRQNQTDLHCYPLGADDRGIAKLNSQLMKYIMVRRSQSVVFNDAYLDSLIGSIGWVSAEVDYDGDVMDGDIRLVKENPFYMMFDYNSQSITLDDAEYLFRFRSLSKNQAKYLLHANEEFLEKNASNTSERIGDSPRGNEKRVRGIEYWYREREKKLMIFSAESGEVDEWDGDAKELKAFCAADERFFDVSKEVTRMKMALLVGDEMCYIGDSPRPEIPNDFPFVPIFYNYFPSYSDTEETDDDLSLRIQSLVRPMIDCQREKNKRRSTIMDVVLSQPLGKYFTEEGALVDPTQMYDANEMFIKINPGKTPPTPIRSNANVSELMKLEEMAGNDMREISLNHEMMGMSDEKGAPGVVTNLRQRQGILSVQSSFDNLRIAKMRLGRYILAMISEWSNSKVEKIIGEPLMIDYAEAAKETEFDVVVDEITESPSFRMSMYATLADLAHQGVPVPQETIYEFLPVDEATHQKMLGNLQAQQQMQQQMAQPPAAQMPQQ